jgi:hypothetical protein
MLGAVISGFLPSTNCVQVDLNRFLLRIEPNNIIDTAEPTDRHITIFMTQTFLPEGYAVSIHWHKLQEGAEWIYLGFIHNFKPSAHFSEFKHSPDCNVSSLVRNSL